MTMTMKLCKLWHRICCYIGWHSCEKVIFRRDIKANGKVVASVLFKNVLKCKHCGLYNAKDASTEIETGVKGEC